MVVRLLHRVEVVVLVSAVVVVGRVAVDKVLVSVVVVCGGGSGR